MNDNLRHFPFTFTYPLRSLSPEGGIMPPEADTDARTLSDHDTIQHDVPEDAPFIATEALEPVELVGPWLVILNVFSVHGVDQLAGVEQIVAAAVHSNMDIERLLRYVQYFSHFVQSFPGWTVVLTSLLATPGAALGIAKLLGVAQALLTSLPPDVSIDELHQILRGQVVFQQRLGRQQSTDLVLVPEEHDPLSGTSASAAASSPAIVGMRLECECPRTNGCLGYIEITPPTDLKTVVSAHLATYHGTSGACPSGACQWNGCCCSPLASRQDCPRPEECVDSEACKSRKCKHRPPPHPAHVEDLADHIVKCHFRLRFGCDQCGQSSFKSETSIKGHHKKCVKKVEGEVETAVRCGHCYAEFDSEAAVGRHFAVCTVRNRSASTPAASAQV